jgi:hypothetical protein
MTLSVSFLPASDPLARTAPLHLRAAYPFFGKPLTLHSNSQAVMDAAERSLALWHQLEPELREDAPELTLTLIVHPGSGVEPSRPPLTYRLHGETFVAGAGSNLFAARTDQHEALGFVTPEMVADDVYFRHYVLESLALLLATWRGQDRVPVHAAGIVRNGRAVLLAGHSTSGKSTLCYACWRAGLEILSEDAVYVSQAGGVRLWGQPGFIHLLPDAPRLFPELAGIPAGSRPDGSEKLVVDLGATGYTRRCIHAEPAALCLLQRHASQDSWLEPVPVQTAVDILCKEVASGFVNLFGDLLGAAIAAAASDRAFVLKVGRNLEGAIARLDELTS